MTTGRNIPAAAVGALMGAIIGFVFGGITAFGAMHGDSSIRSGLSAAFIFALTFAGSILSAICIAELWKFARSEHSASWVGIVSAIPFTLTSLVVASPRSELFSPIELVAFIGADVICGVVLGQVGWKYFGPLSGPDDDSLPD